jgi:hypothetical protein
MGTIDPQADANNDNGVIHEDEREHELGNTRENFNSRKKVGMKVEHVGFPSAMNHGKIADSVNSYDNEGTLGQQTGMNSVQKDTQMRSGSEIGSELRLNNQQRMKVDINNQGAGDHDMGENSYVSQQM